MTDPASSNAPTLPIAPLSSTSTYDCNITSTGFLPDSLPHTIASPLSSSTVVSETDATTASGARLPRNQWSRIFGSLENFLAIYKQSGVFFKDIENEKEKDKDKDRDKVGVSTSKKTSKNDNVNSSSNSLNEHQINEAKIKKICNFLTLKNSVVQVMANVFEIITKSSVLKEEKEDEKEGEMELVVEIDEDDSKSVDGNMDITNSQHQSHKDKEKWSDNISDRILSMPFLTCVSAEDLEAIYENQGLTWYSLSKEFSKEHSSVNSMQRTFLQKSFDYFSEGK